MSFYIRVLPHSNAVPNVAKAEIALRDHVESFPLITSRWTIADYEAQWRNSLKALTTGAVDACVLVTDLQPIEDSAGMSYWVLFREQETIFVQERLMRTLSFSANDLFRPEEIEPIIPPRIQGTAEEFSQVSEWIISKADVVEFLAT
jgi:CdiI N-terminal domain